MTGRMTLAANNGSVGGGEVMLIRTATALRQLGMAVEVVGPQHPSALVDLAATEGFPTTAIHNHGRRDYARHLRTWDRRERRGALWCHGLLPAAATAGHRDRIVHLHQQPQNAMQWSLLPVVRRRALATLVPSHYLATEIPATEALPNWTDVLPAAPRGDRDLVGYLGRISTDKGVATLARALARAPGGPRLLLAGDARFVPEQRLRPVDEALAELGDRVDRPGWMGREDFFARVGLAVFPSEWDEPFGLVVAEAMAARVPFVISDAGALPEVAGPAYPWVARRGDPGSLAEVIRAALDASTTEVDQTVSRAHDRWRSHYSPEAGLTRVEALIRRLGLT